QVSVPSGQRRTRVHRVLSECPGRRWVCQPETGGARRWVMVARHTVGRPVSGDMTQNTASTPLSPEQLLEIYDVPGASAAEFLCDRHDPAAVAFTIIDADLSGRDITYGELRTESEKVAAAL